MVSMLLTLRGGLATPEDYNFTIYRRYQSCEILRHHLESAPAAASTEHAYNRNTGGYPPPPPPPTSTQFKTIPSVQIFLEKVLDYRMSEYLTVNNRSH